MDRIFDYFFMLIYMPKVVFWCAVFAYEGFVNGSTLTHVGFKDGFIARVYGVFYSLFIVFSILSIPINLRGLLQMDGEIIRQSLLYVEPVGVGLIFIGFAVLFFLLKIVILKKSTRSRRMNKAAHKAYNSILFFLCAVGIQNLISAPQWVLLGIIAIFTYFSAFLSPKTIIKAMKPDVGNNFSYFRKTAKQGALNGNQGLKPGRKIEIQDEKFSGNR